jgi:aryl-alcohol dehydrogenase-like predicted oxidoreductase
MEQRQLGRSGLVVPALGFGTGTFGGANEYFKHWGAVDQADATRMVDMCLDAGVTLFDSADGYSDGLAEQMLGTALGGRRSRALISTKATFRTGKRPNDVGSSRWHLVEAVEAALRRLGTDYIDLFQLHGFDARTPVEETLRALDDMVRAGKIRYTGCSNFSGWHLMKSLAVSDRYGWTRYAAHQAYYSLVSREYEWELLPLALDQGVGTVVWSPLSWGRLSGKIHRGTPISREARFLKNPGGAPPVPEETLFRVTDALDAVSRETGKSVPQAAINWLLQRPTVSTVIIGARTIDQLRDNLGAADWNLTAAQVETLDDASAPFAPYPYWHQLEFVERNPFPTVKYPGK